MKKFLLTGSLILVLPLLQINDAAAKSPASKLAENDMQYCDTDKDGFLTLDEFKKRNKRAVSRGDRRNLRAARKGGYYKTDEERFKEMDKEGTGKITVRDLEAYYSSRRAAGESLY